MHFLVINVFLAVKIVPCCSLLQPNVWLNVKFELVLASSTNVNTVQYSFYKLELTRRFEKLVVKLIYVSNDVASNMKAVVITELTCQGRRRSEQWNLSGGP